MSVQRSIPRRRCGRLPGTVVALTLALALAGSARASGDAELRKPDVEPPAPSVFKIALPADWTPDPEASKVTSSDAHNANYFGGVMTQSGADSFLPMDGLAFHVVWAATIPPVDDPPAVLRHELDREKQIWCGEGDRKRLSWSESIFDDVASAELVWQSNDLGTVSRSRMLAYATPEKRARIVIAECVMRQDKQKEYDPLCQQVLATLGARNEKRAPLTGLPPSKVGDGCPTVAKDDGIPEGAVESKGPRMGAAPENAGKAGVLYTGEGTGTEEHSNKWFFIVGGALLIVAVYLTTRNRQVESSEGEQESEGEALRQHPTEGRAPLRVSGQPEDEASGDEPDEGDDTDDDEGERSE